VNVAFTLLIFILVILFTVKVAAEVCKKIEEKENNVEV
jgi:hypothetical protein